jgi:hypothetical protein
MDYYNDMNLSSGRSNNRKSPASKQASLIAAAGYKQQKNVNIWYNSPNGTDSNDEYSGILLDSLNPSQHRAYHNNNNSTYHNNSTSKSFLLSKKSLDVMTQPNLNSNTNSNTTTNTASTILTNGSYDSYENEEQDSMMEGGSSEVSHERSYDHDDHMFSGDDHQNSKHHRQQQQQQQQLGADSSSSNTKLIQWQKSKLYLNETISLDVDDTDEKVVGILV